MLEGSQTPFCWATLSTLVVSRIYLTPGARYWGSSHSPALQSQGSQKLEKEKPQTLRTVGRICQQEGSSQQKRGGGERGAAYPHTGGSLVQRLAGSSRWRALHRTLAIAMTVPSLGQ